MSSDWLTAGEAFDAAVESECVQIKKSPNRLVEALWRWQDESDSNADRLGLALKDLARDGSADALFCILDQSIKAEAQKTVRSPSRVGAMYGAL